jgi:hypothetical protein
MLKLISAEVCGGRRYSSEGADDRHPLPSLSRMRGRVRVGAQFATTVGERAPPAASGNDS